MKIVLIFLIFAICQTVFGDPGAPAGSANDNMKMMMEQLKQIQSPPTAAKPPAPPAQEQETEDDWKSTSHSSKSPASGLSDQRKMELAEYACRKQSHGVPCSYSAGDGSRISGVCYKAGKPNGLYCKASNYPKPTPPPVTGGAALPPSVPQMPSMPPVPPPNGK